MKEEADILNEHEARFMAKLLGLQGNKVTKLTSEISPSADWGAATTLERRGLLRRSEKGFYATVRGLNAVEFMLGQLSFSQIG